MIQGRLKNGAELKDLEKQVRRARHLIHQPELKVEAIETSIYQTEKFYPKIKIIRRPAKTGTDEAGFGLFAEKLFTGAR